MYHELFDLLTKEQKKELSVVAFSKIKEAISLIDPQDYKDDIRKGMAGMIDWAFGEVDIDTQPIADAFISIVMRALDGILKGDKNAST